MALVTFKMASVVDTDVSECTGVAVRRHNSKSRKDGVASFIEVQVNNEARELKWQKSEFCFYLRTFTGYVSRSNTLCFDRHDTYPHAIYQPCC